MELQLSGLLNKEEIINTLGDGYWEWDAPSNHFNCDQTTRNLLCIDDSFPGQMNCDIIKDYIYPSDLESLFSSLKPDHLQSDFSFVSNLRIRSVKEKYEWFCIRGKVLEWSPQSLPVHIIGTLSKTNHEKEFDLYQDIGQSLYQAIANDETVMICRFGIDGRLTYVNRTLCQFLGFNEQHLSGEFVFSYVHPDDRDFAIKQIGSLKPGSLIRDYENRILCHDNKYHWVHWRNHLINNPDSDITEIQSVGQDVTETHNILDFYNERTNFDRLMVKLIGKISSYYHEELDKIIDDTLSELGRVLDVDRAYLFSFDFAQESFSSTHEWCNSGVSSIKQSCHNLLFTNFPWWTSTTREREILFFKSLEDIPKEAISEKIFLSGLGIDSFIAFALRTKGNNIGFLGFDLHKDSRIWQDYTQMLLIILAEAIANAIEGNNASHLIQLNEARERLFIDALPALIVRIDKQGDVLDYTAGCHGVLSQYVALHTPSKVKTLADLFEKQIAIGIIERLSKAYEILPNKLHEFEINVAGQITTLEMKFSPINDGEFILIFQDISEKKNLEQIKNDFINNTTHEMRTPLTTILLMIDLMEKTQDEDKHDQYWQILKSEVRRERMLVEDLLTVSRIEKGKFILASKPIEICSSLNEAISNILPQAENAGIEIDTQMPAKELLITGDPQACQIVFSNLLSNAIKFSPEHGNIEIIVTEDEGEIKITFADHGIGIPDEDLPFIFSRFFRGKNAVASEIQGSGIGLYIVDHLVHDMGGSVSVKSQVGQGTQFSITFPCQMTNLTS